MNSIGSHLERDLRRRSGIVGWWLTLTTPKIAEDNVPLAQRETIRRGNLAGGVIFFLLVALLVVFAINLRNNNYPIVGAVSVMIIVTFIAILYNRAGKTTIAGLLLALGYEGTVFSAILFGFPHGLAPSVIGLYDMLLVSIVFFAICLPPGWLWMPAVINITLIVVDVFLQPGNQAFQLMLMTDRVAVLSRPAMLNIIVAAGFFAVVKYMVQSMQRADHAEEVLELERQIARQNEELKREIQVIQEALTWAANRVATNEDILVQVPLARENVLWSIASALNVLFQRLKSSRRSINQINTYVLHLTTSLRHAQATQNPPQFPPSDLGEPWPQFLEALRSYAPSSRKPQSTASPTASYSPVQTPSPTPPAPGARASQPKRSKFPGT